MTEWPKRALVDLCDPDRRIAYGILKVGDFVDDGVPVIRGGDVREGRVVFDEAKRVTKEISDQFTRTILRGGEIVINLISEPGHSAIVPSDFAGYNVSRDVAVIPLGETVHHRFVDYFLRSQWAIDWLTARLQGSVTQKINIGTLRELPVPNPPLAEQKAIAAVLGALDDKIELNRRMNATLEAMARALFQSWFVDFDTVRAKLDGRPPVALDPATAALFPTQFEESAFGQIPKGWTIREVGELIDVKHGFAFPGDCFREDPTGDILLTPGNFAVGGGFKDNKVKYFEGAVPQDYVLREHDLVLTMTDLSKAADTLGYPATIPAPPHGRRYLHNQRLGKVVIKDPHAVNSTFLYRLFCSDAYRNEILAGATGTTVKHTSPSRIRAFRTVFPTADVLRAFEGLVKPWYLRTAHNRSESRTLATLRDTLLPKLLSGELSVADRL